MKKTAQKAAHFYPTVSGQSRIAIEEQKISVVFLKLLIEKRILLLVIVYLANPNEAYLFNKSLC